MSQQTEDRPPEPAGTDPADRNPSDLGPSDLGPSDLGVAGVGVAQPTLAQVLPFERSSELQRAVQMRALESMERQRAQAAKRPNPVRRVAMFALALIPVALLFIAIDGLLRVFHHMNDLYNSPEANAVAAPAEPAVDVSEPEPGVVLLQDLHSPDVPAQPPR